MIERSALIALGIHRDAITDFKGTQDAAARSPARRVARPLVAVDCSSVGSRVFPDESGSKHQFCRV